MIVEEIDLRIAPLELLEHLEGEPGLAYVEGVAGPGGRHLTVLGCSPQATLEIRADGTAVGTPPGWVRSGSEPLAAIDTFLSASARPASGASFPLCDVAIGYLAYDLRTAIEQVPARALDDLGLPLAVLARYDTLVVHEGAHRRYYIVSAGGRSAVAEWRSYLLDRLARPLPSRAPAPTRSVAGALRSNMSLEEYRAAIDRIHDYIAAGDVYQVNFTQRFTARLLDDPIVVFGRLARCHPMPHTAYFDAGSFQILSNSPELFLERRGARIATRPIKGTRPRGRTPDEDTRLSAELLADPKELAEHVMIVDLERNDLGRICRPGTVRIRDFARVETFPSLHHLVSTVEGELEPGLSPADILRATFPGGSITGAPKIRAMEIIDDLEPNARGVYTGALGIIDRTGDMHLSLPIRTAVTTGGSVYYGSGGGIVADSDADAEYAESLLKADAFLHALGTQLDAHS
jgi:para-aminobenzoate synthetase component 1